MHLETDIVVIAKRFAALSEQSKTIEKELTILKAQLRQAGPQSFLLLDESLKVVVAEPVRSTAINAAALGEHLLTNKRKNDFLAVAKVTATDLNKLIDGADLCEQFKYELDPSEPRVTASALSKKDLEIIAERGSSALGNVIRC